MDFTRSLKVFLGLLVCMANASICHAQQSNDWFSKFSPNAVFRLAGSVDNFTQIVCEEPGMANDTIWVDGEITSPMWKIQAGLEDENILVISQDKKGKKAQLKNVFYPLNAIRKNKEGRIEATCIVEEDGSLTDVKILNSVYPSIDAEALRIFSEVKLLPCKIGEKAIRCRHKISVLFEIVDREHNYARVLVVDPEAIPEGVSKRFRYNITKVQTTTQTKKDRYGILESNSSTTGRWTVDLKVDVPKDDLDFEKMLCGILYGKSSKSIQAGGTKFADKFTGTIKNKDFKGVRGTALTHTAYCLSYKPGKYYSYGYVVSLKPYAFSDQGSTIPYNFIYDIQSKRVLTLADVLTGESIMAMGLNAEESYDLGVDEYFLYIGKNGQRIDMVAISQENWNKFSSNFQALLGEKDAHPLSFTRDNFKNKGYLGIQLMNLNQKILGIPSFGVNNVYLQSHIKENLNLPDSVMEKGKSLEANILYVIEKDGTISNVEISQTDNGTELRDELLRIFQTMPRRQSLVLSIDGPVRSYHMMKYRLSLR